jgi:hypothetical protein
MDEQALEAEQDRRRTVEDARAKLLADIAQGVAAIKGARDAAQGDIATAQNLRDQANALSAIVGTKRTQTAAWQPSPTYTPGDLVAIRDAVVDVLTRQQQIIDTLAGMLGYRVAVDRNAILTDDVLLWLARFVADVID